MFYLKFIENTKPSDNGLWMKIFGQQSYKIWSGFCFETICIKHVEQIKEALKISGIHSVSGCWIEKKAKSNAQIDLLIDRDDNVINICEIKLHNTKFAIDSKYGQEIANKIEAFSLNTKTKKYIFVTFITSYGLINNQYSNQYVQSELTMDDLFHQL